MNSEDQFIYRQFRVSADRTTAIFEFTLQHAGQAHDLAETLTFPAPLLDTPAQQRSLRALHVALGISYYKLFVPPVIVQPYAMDAAEADFWNQVWHDGLGEFLYVNKLPVERVAQFAAQDGVQFDEPHTGGDANSVADQANQAAAHHGALLGIGGGKDSIVAGELLKALAVPVTGFVMATGEQRGQAAAVAQVMDAELLAVERVLDKQFMTLRELPGAYHGHVPISMIFGLVGTVLAIATGREYVIVANEASASIPRIQWGDRSVNHQWSKSFGFEQQLQQFVHMSIAPDVTYFSVIRQLTSIGVAKLFANFSQYFEVFTSDNSVESGKPQNPQQLFTAGAVAGRCGPAADFWRPGPAERPIAANALFGADRRGGRTATGLRGHSTGANAVGKPAGTGRALHGHSPNEAGRGTRAGA
jgi:hypothetical protein